MNIGLKTFLKYSGNRRLYDAEIEYLESTGTQWIDTGITAINYGNGRHGIRCECEVTWPAVPTSRETVIGSYAYSTTAGMNGERFCPVTTGYNRPHNWGWANKLGYEETNMAIIPGVRYSVMSILQSNFNYLYVKPDNSAGVILVNQTGTWDWLAAPSLALFTRRQANTQSMFAKVRLYNLKLRNPQITDSYVRDFIPVRKGNVGYMYDRVSGKLFGNQGTGSFIVGPDKNK